ncbi:MAG: class I SAM-dependent methyltransferase [Rickettsiaceae bacterium]|nr:class I SAM-dependent methyltransferase [Rickettsiaceae bacterium]
MFDVDYEANPKEYANFFKNVKREGTDYLAFRDLHKIFKKYDIKLTSTLDYGCGAGKSIDILKKIARNYHEDLNIEGVDINPEMLKVAQSKDPSGKYTHIEDAKTPFPDNYFTFVFCSWVLVEISSKAKILELLKEVRRIMSPGAIFIAVVCTEEFYNKKWLSFDTDFPENKDLYSTKKVRLCFKDISLIIRDYYWSEEDYKSLYKDSGLTLEEIYKPLASETDSTEWCDELHHPPYALYIAKK